MNSLMWRQPERAPVVLPSEYQKSFLDYESYPANLMLRSTTAYSSTLKAYQARLDEAKEDLFATDEHNVEVPYREFNTASGKEFVKLNVHSSAKLYHWLGIRHSVETQGEKTFPSVEGRDPKCRFIYIYGESSRTELKITKQMLMLLFSFHQVMPVYLDFMFVFGAQSNARDLRFSGFREQTMLRSPPRGPAMPELGRSGRQFQICYNLKGVTLKKTDPEDIDLHDWSIRQTAIHHQFDVVYGTTLWIVTKGNKDLQQRFKELTGTDGRPEDKDFSTPESCFRASLSAHLMYCYWSTEGWRWYIRWLENVIEKESAMAVIGRRGPGYAHKQYKPHDIQDLQYWQDKTNEAVMVLEANLDVLNSLKCYYTGLKQLKDFPQELKDSCDDDISTFSSHIGDIMHDFKMQISRAKLLAGIISDRKGLIMQHLQGQASERTEKLNQNMDREATVMRIVTIVTLLYLPATFVSTFFSTDVVKFQNQNGGPPSSGTFSTTALQRWLQVTIPLTALTLFLAWATYKLAERAREHKRSNKLSPKSRTRLGVAFLKGLWQKSPTLPLHGGKPGVTSGYG